MAKRWACGVLFGLGVAGLLPQPALAQGFPVEPMPMQAAPPAGAYGSMGYPTAAPGYDPAMGGFPGMPMLNPGPAAPGTLPGVGLPMGGTYYPGAGQGDCPEGLAGCLHKLLYTADGERRQVYGKIGYIGLKRESLPRTPLITVEPEFVFDFSDPFNPVTRPSTDGDGDSTLGFNPVVFDLNGLSPRLNQGLQFALGLQEADNGVMWEIGGFYISNSQRRSTFLLPGRLDSPYINPPIGFEGNLGLWTNADFMQVTFNNSVWSGEANARFFGVCWKGLDINYLVGLRYIKLYERMSHFTIDDDIQFGIDDPFTRATLNWKGENDMFGAQVGFSLIQRFSNFLSVSYDQKVAFLANASQASQSLVRGDGFVGYDVSHTSWRFGQAYEGGLYLDVAGGNFRVRAGWDLKIYTGVSAADRQFTYDLQAGPNMHRTSGTILYHGPSASVEFVF
jgi:hypothetical protein